MVSIIVPVLNEAANMPGLLRHLDALAGESEIIIVDGGSEDGTVEIAAGAGEVRLVQARRGRGRQIARGVAAASGEVVLILHADCRLAEDSLERIEEACGKGHQWGWFDLRYRPARLSLKAVEWVLNRQARAFHSPVGEQAMFVRGDALDSAGGVPPISLMEDVVLSRRLRRGAAGIPLGRAVYCSSRRYRQWGVFGMGVRCIALLVGLHLGISPDTLARFYPHVR